MVRTSLVQYFFKYSGKKEAIHSNKISTKSDELYGIL